MENIYLFAIESITSTVDGETKQVGVVRCSGESTLSIERSLKTKFKGSAGYAFMITPDQARQLIEDLKKALLDLE